MKMDKDKDIISPKNILDWMFYVLSWIAFPFSVLLLKLLFLIFPEKDIEKKTMENLRKVNYRRAGFYICVYCALLVYMFIALGSFLYHLCKDDMTSSFVKEYFWIVCIPAAGGGLFTWLTKNYEESVSRRSEMGFNTAIFLWRSAKTELKKQLFEDPNVPEGEIVKKERNV